MLCISPRNSMATWQWSGSGVGWPFWHHSATHWVWDKHWNDMNCIMISSARDWQALLQHFVHLVLERWRSLWNKRLQRQTPALLRRRVTHRHRHHLPSIIRRRHLRVAICQHVVPTTLDTRRLSSFQVHFTSWLCFVSADNWPTMDCCWFSSLTLCSLQIIVRGWIAVCSFR